MVALLVAMVILLRLADARRVIQDDLEHTYGGFGGGKGGGAGGGEGGGVIYTRCVVYVSVLDNLNDR